MRCHAVLLPALVSCTHAVRLATPAPKAAVYDVAVLSASGERRVSSLYTLATEPVDAHTWSIRTLYTEGTWEDGGDAMAFDSRRPRPTDPWPLTLQHAISSVPVQVVFDETGQPFSLADAGAWEERVRMAVDALSLPDEATSTAAQLTDVDGLLRDLKRSFTGTPSPNDVWRRPERMSGVDGVREETCTSTTQRGRTTHTCAGPLHGPTQGNARLTDATSRTVLVVDRRGLSSLEAEYLGTLVVLGPDGKPISDRPIGGKRWVVRK